MDSKIESCDKRVNEILCGLKMKSWHKIRDRIDGFFFSTSDICRDRTQRGVQNSFLVPLKDGHLGGFKRYTKYRMVRAIYISLFIGITKNCRYPALIHISSAESPVGSRELTSELRFRIESSRRQFIATIAIWSRILIDEVLLLRRDEIDVFCCPSRLGQQLYNSNFMSCGDGELHSLRLFKISFLWGPLFEGIYHFC